MDLNRLWYFYWVAKENGFTRASRTLKIAQPAISRMVKNLEETLGAPLFVRHKRQVSLTHLGNLVYRHCEVIFENTDAIRKLSNRGAPIYSGPLRLAAADALAINLLPAALSEFSELYPNVVPAIQSGPTDLMIERIVKKELAFGLFFYIPSHLEHAVEVQRLKPMRFRLVVATRHAKRVAVLSNFIGSREVDTTEVKNYPTLTRLRKQYPKAQIRLSANSLLLHRECVLKGLGVSILPDFLVRNELKKRILTDVLPKTQLTFDLNLVKPLHAPLSELSERFVECLRNALAKVDIS